jgi:outer membrane biosynthesis protein TonB
MRWLGQLSRLRQLASVLVPALCALAYAAGPRVYITVGPRMFRAYATSAKLPVYPLSSISVGHEGRAVVKVVVSEAGYPLSVEVLEAVAEAVSLWRFRPFLLQGRKDPVRAESRLVFYFRIVGGKPRVVDAALRSRDQE